MYVREKRVRNKTGRYYSYFQLVRGERVDGKVRQRVVKHLGRFEGKWAHYNADLHARRLGLLCGVIGCGNQATKLYYYRGTRHNFCDKHREELAAGETLYQVAILY
jgi:hypothetical protein